MKIVEKIVLPIVMSAVLTSTITAGGKAGPLATSPVVPIAVPEIVNPIPFYIGVGILVASINRDPCPCTPNAEDIGDHRYGSILRVGWDYNAFVGIEARALKTFGNDTFSTTEHYGIYLKPQYQVAEQLNMYALLGYGRTTIDYTNGILSSTNSHNGFAYGVGLEYNFGTSQSDEDYDNVFDEQENEKTGWGMWIDVQHLLSDEGPLHTDSNILTIGITYNF